MPYYEEEFKKKIVALKLNEGRSAVSIAAEYGIGRSTVSNWCKEFSEECRKKAESNPGALNEAELMKENLRLRKELEEVNKENEFLKKAAAFFAKEIN